MSLPSPTALRVRLAGGLTADKIIAQHPIEDRCASLGRLTSHDVTLRSGAGSALFWTSSSLHANS